MTRLKFYRKLRRRYHRRGFTFDLPLKHGSDVRRLTLVKGFAKYLIQYLVPRLCYDEGRAFDRYGSPTVNPWER